MARHHGGKHMKGGHGMHGTTVRTTMEAPMGKHHSGGRHHGGKKHHAGRHHGGRGR